MEQWCWIALAPVHGQRGFCACRGGTCRKEEVFGCYFPSCCANCFAGCCGLEVTFFFADLGADFLTLFFETTFLGDAFFAVTTFFFVPDFFADTAFFVFPTVRSTEIDGMG